MKTPLTLFAIAALLFALLSSPALCAPGQGKGKNKSKGKSSSTPGKGKKKSKFKPVPPGQAKRLSNLKRGAAQTRFQDRDRALFQTHFAKYKQHPHGLPPGLAKNLQRGKPLPPGWQKKLREGWIIDDAHWTHFQPVPHTYLPPSFRHPQDTGIYLVGDRLVRVHKPNREIIDLIRIATIVLNR